MNPSAPSKAVFQNLSRKIAFTLIELLVVITIIAVLLALLTPALDRAVYQAELAACAARQKATMNAVSVYAATFKRQYPYRPVIETAGGTPFGQLNSKDQGVAGTVRDDRVALKGFVPINKCLNCPLLTPIDIEFSKPDTATWSEYSLWFGWHYEKMAGMRKVGDRVIANFEYSTQSKEERRYDLLVSDMTQVMLPSAKYGMSTHPDSKGLWTPARYQDEFFGASAYSAFATIAWWTGGGVRGTIDLNYGYQDGAVFRSDRIAFQPADNDGIDYIYHYTRPSNDLERFTQVPSGH